MRWGQTNAGRSRRAQKIFVAPLANTCFVAFTTNASTDSNQRRKYLAPLPPLLVQIFVTAFACVNFGITASASTRLVSHPIVLLLKTSPIFRAFLPYPSLGRCSFAALGPSSLTFGHPASRSTNAIAVTKSMSDPAPESGSEDKPLSTDRRTRSWRRCR